MNSTTLMLKSEWRGWLVMVWTPSSFCHHFFRVKPRSNHWHPLPSSPTEPRRRTKHWASVTSFSASILPSQQDLWAQSLLLLHLGGSGSHTGVGADGWEAVGLGGDRQAGPLNGNAVAWRKGYVGTVWPKKHLSWCLWSLKEPWGQTSI